VRTDLDKLGTVNRLTIRWVPRHNNIPGNELADNLTRKGAENPLFGPGPFCGVGTEVTSGRKTSVLLGTPIRTRTSRP